MDIEQRIRRDRRIIKEATEEHIKNTEKKKTYTEEFERILKVIEEETGKVVSSVDEAEDVFAEVLDDLHAQSEKVEEILRKVGKLP